MEPATAKQIRYLRHLTEQADGNPSYVHSRLLGEARRLRGRRISELTKSEASIAIDATLEYLRKIGEEVA